MAVYRIVHIKPDKSEVIIMRTSSIEDAKTYTDQAQFDGFWLGNNSKILKKRAGEIQIRLEDNVPQLIDYQIVKQGRSEWVECRIKHGAGLAQLHFTKNVFIGLDLNGEILWSMSALTDIAERVNKELAYEISKIYDQKF